MKTSRISVAICTAALAAWAAASSSPAIADDLSFAGKKITMTIGFAGGSGTDLYGRTLGRHLSNHLPGKPGMIVVNRPGAGGIVGLNDWDAKAEPNGLFVTTGHQSQVDPDSLKRANARYDPTTFKFVGGVGSYSQGLYVADAAAKRLTDGSASPVNMGIVGSTLRGGNYQALWGATLLGWNVKWVTGYQSTADVLLAMQRGEIDMGSFGSVADAQHLLSAGNKFTVISQAGTFIGGKMVKSPWLGDAPFIAELLEGKIADPQAQLAFDYWQDLVQIGIWFALPPRTPEAVVAAYDTAFQATIRDPAFLAEYAKINPDALFVSGADVLQRVINVSRASPQTLRYIDQLLQKQGFAPNG